MLVGFRIELSADHVRMSQTSYVTVDSIVGNHKKNPIMM